MYFFSLIIVPYFGAAQWAGRTASPPLRTMDEDTLDVRRRRRTGVERSVVPVAQLRPMAIQSPIRLRQTVGAAR
jgi:hypothetical protein